MIRPVVGAIAAVVVADDIVAARGDGNVELRVCYNYLCSGDCTHRADSKLQAGHAIGSGSWIIEAIAF